MNNYLYGVAALFNNPNDIIKVAKKIKEEGFRDFDVNTPYPVHGMDSAMGLKPSKLGYFALFSGMIGMFSAIGFILWVTMVDYPLIIGGKPFFSWPAFIPVVFEVTVLTTAILTISSMIVFLFKFPNNSHPLHDTSYMRKVSSDKFGIIVKSSDENFNVEKVKKIFSDFSPDKVEEIYYDKEEISFKPALFNKKLILALIAEFILVSVVVYFILNVLLYMPPFSWMSEQNKLGPQQISSFFSDKFGMRIPPEGTISRNQDNYKYKNPPEYSEKNLVNPILMNEESIKTGKEKYLIYCSPCHGNTGKGDSRLRGQFPNPPTLHSEKVINWGDGHIYHIISEGQNIMPSYSSQLSSKERWSIINYIRVLQRAGSAKEADLK